MTTAKRAASTHRALDWAVVRRRLGRVMLYAMLVSGCLVTLLPFLWMILASFKSSSEIIRIPPTLWPEKPTLAGYQTILNDPKLPLGRFYLNSLIVAGSQVLMILFTSSLAGFILAKYQFFGKGALFGFILATMMIPGQVTMIPGYLMLARLGLIDSLWGLIVPSAVSAFGIFLMKQFIEGLPSELLDAARIDGASEWGIYWRIVLAQVGPALATLGILTFMGSWNSYLWPLIVITTHERRTLPIVLTWYSSVHGGRTDLTMAAGVLVVIPILIVYTFIQRWIVQGISMTGFK
ncbi:MAG: carbohydrate ABC transporter permease [Anaerolineae bacterium]|nr:MAG: carbohydrate ABC transporter permease [Anaerolineae bacterium]